MPGLKYVEPKGRILFVDEKPDGFVVVYEKAPMVNSKYNHDSLKTYQTEQEAQDALDCVAEKESWKSVFELEIEGKKRKLEKPVPIETLVKLSKEERLDRAIQQQQIRDEIVEIEGELKREKESFKKDIEDLEAKMIDLKRAIQNSVESQIIEGSWEKDFDSGLLILVQHNPLKIIKVKPMTQEEAQTEAVLETGNEEEEGTEDEQEENEAADS